MKKSKLLQFIQLKMIEMHWPLRTARSKKPKQNRTTKSLSDFFAFHLYNRFFCWLLEASVALTLGNNNLNNKAITIFWPLIFLTFSSAWFAAEGLELTPRMIMHHKIKQFSVWSKGTLFIHYSVQYTLPNK